MTEIMTADIIQLQGEAGLIENQQRLRAIIAERRVRELEAEMALLKAAPNSGILDEKT